MDKQFYVYLHRRADTNEVFYVGKGSGKRAWATQSRCSAWKECSQKFGLLVEIDGHFNCEDAAFDRERELIKIYRQESSTLVNITNGGQGKSGFVETQAAKSRRVEALRASIYDPVKGKKRSAAISAALTGKKFSEERRLRLSEAHKGFRPTEATILKLKNRVFSDAHIAAFRNATNDPVANKKRSESISKTMTGYVKSDEHRAALSAAAKADWARRKALKEKLNTI